MIGYLKGKLHAIHDDHIILDVHGVGYRLYLSQMNLAALPQVGTETEWHIATNVREDAIQLYAFSSTLELRVYNLLIAVSGIGPRQAINMLSNCLVERLAQAIVNLDDGFLQSIRGVGQKTAEKIILELKGPMAKLLKNQALPAAALKETPWRRDLVGALEQLGYRRQQIEEVLQQIDIDAQKSLQETIRVALRLLSPGKSTVSRSPS